MADKRSIEKLNCSPYWLPGVTGRKIRSHFTLSEHVRGTKQFQFTSHSLVCEKIQELFTCCWKT